MSTLYLVINKRDNEDNDDDDIETNDLGDFYSAPLKHIRVGSGQLKKVGTTVAKRTCRFYARVNEC